MTEKRFFYSDMKERRSPPCIIDMKGMRYCNLQEVVKPLNKLSDENEQLKKDATILVYSNQEYRWENEQLKKELERCKDWINSDKNDYELTLAFIKNKGYSLKDVLEYEKELKK